jgi:hypothetical protein
MDFQEATRKPFPVKVAQITLKNIEDVAKWCNGTVEMRPTRMLGTLTDLPVIVVKEQGGDRSNGFEAALGCWIVELKNNFRCYKQHQFDSAFDLVPKKPSHENHHEVLDVQQEVQRAVGEFLRHESETDDQPLTEIYQDDNAYQKLV